MHTVVVILSIILLNSYKWMSPRSASMSFLIFLKLTCQIIKPIYYLFSQIRSVAIILVDIRVQKLIVKYNMR